jgi:hypothetical protein
MGTLLVAYFILGSCPADSSALKIQATYSSAMSFWLSKDYLSENNAVGYLMGKPKEVFRGHRHSIELNALIQGILLIRSFMLSPFCRSHKSLKVFSATTREVSVHGRFVSLKSTTNLATWMSFPTPSQTALYFVSASPVLHVFDIRAN